jgi:hypothetical protein
MRLRTLALVVGLACSCAGGAATAFGLSSYSTLWTGDFRGFEPAVETIDGQTTHWTREYARIEFPVLRWRPLRIEVFVRAPGAAISHDLTALITADDLPLGVVRVNPAWKRYEFVVQRASSLAGPLTLRFYSQTQGEPARGVGVGRIGVRPAGIAGADAVLLMLGGTLSLAVWLFVPIARPVRSRIVCTFGPMFDRWRPAATRLLLAGVVLAGIAIRIPHLDEPPLQFHPTRQYRSALMARGYVVDMLHNLSPAELAAVKNAAAAQEAIEPPVFEHAAAILYRLAGQEALWIPRLFGALVWVFGAFPIWWLARSVREDRRHPGMADAGGLTAVAVYLLLPFGATASQAFQPDAIMTALIAASLGALTWHYRRRSGTTLVTSSGLAALAAFIKPMALFFILPPALVLAVGRVGFWQGARRWAAWTIFVAAPTVTWYVYIAVTAPSVLRDRFFPQLLARQDFWADWVRMADRVATRPILLLALIGVVLTARATRGALVAASAGYVAFGMLFSYHIHTHDYYSLPLIPLGAWAIGALVQFGGSGRPSLPRTALSVGLRAAVVLLAVSAVMSAWRHRLYAPDPDAPRQAARYEQIGRLVNHSSRVITLDKFYGFGLAYHGRLVASNLPLGADRALSSLAGRSAVVDASRQLAAGEFFVGTIQEELDALPALRNLLAQRYRLVARDGTAERWTYVVYDLQQRTDDRR